MTKKLRQNKKKLRNTMEKKKKRKKQKKKKLYKISCIRYFLEKERSKHKSQKIINLLNIKNKMPKK